MTHLQRRALAATGGTVAMAAVALTLGGPLRELLFPAPPAPPPSAVQRFAFLSPSGQPIDVILPDGTARRIERPEIVPEGTRILSTGAAFEIRIGQSALTIIGRGEILLERTRIDAEGRADVRLNLDLEEGTVFASVLAPTAGSHFEIATADGTVSTTEADFILHQSAQGLSVSVLSGTVRLEHPTQGVFFVRAGESLRPGAGGLLALGAIPEEELEDLRRWAPAIRRRTAELTAPTSIPSDVTKEEHEKYLRKLLKRVAVWFVEEEPRAVLPYVTEPVQINDEKLTMRPLIAFLDQITAGRDIRKIDFTEDAIVFEFDFEETPIIARTYLEGEIQAVEYEDRPEIPEAERVVTCLEWFDFEAWIVFEFTDNVRWRAREIRLEYEPHKEER